MLDEEEYASDTSDDDYVPSDGEAVSEEEGSGDEENLKDLEKDNKDADGSDKKPKDRGKRKKKAAKDFARKRVGGIRLEEEEENAANKKPAEDNYSKELEEQIQKEKEEKKEADEKKKADDLWASFMADVGGPKPKPKPAASSGLGSLTSIVKSTSSSSSIKTVTPSSSQTSSTTPESTSKPSKVTIVKEYDFAGETVKITKEVDAESKEAKAEMKKQEDSTKDTPAKAAPVLGVKRPGGGLGSVLGKIGKKPKISTLDKSKLDWESFKKNEGIQDELAIHNRGKEGYIERQAFLERTDHRQFEIERNLRLSTSKR